MPKLSIIMPVYNEILTVEEAVKRVLSLNIDKELIVFDDGSSDGSREKLIEINKTFDFKLLLHEKNMGKGKGVIDASKYASGEYIIVEDSDLELNHLDIVKLYEIALNDNSIDLVNGNREVNKQNKVNLITIIASLITRILILMLYGKWLKDVLSSYKLCKLKKFKELNIKAERFGFESEWILRAILNKYKIVETPIQYYPRNKKQGKKINYLDGLEIILTIIKLRFTK